MFVCVCAEETGRMKNCLGECSLKVTRPDGKCSKILVPNPVLFYKEFPVQMNTCMHSCVM